MAQRRELISKGQKYFMRLTGKKVQKFVGGVDGSFRVGTSEGWALGVTGDPCSDWGLLETALSSYHPGSHHHIPQNRHMPQTCWMEGSLGWGHVGGQQVNSQAGLGTALSRFLAAWVVCLKQRA